MLYKTVFSEDLNTFEILSDELEWNEQEKIAYARGNASAQNKEKKLLAKELIVYLSEENEIILIKASENVFFYSPKDEATGDQATYDLLKDEPLPIVQNYGPKVGMKAFYHLFSVLVIEFQQQP